MNSIVVIIVLCVAHGIQGQGLLGTIVGGASSVIDSILGTGRIDPCSKNAIEDYREAQSNFYKNLYAKIAAKSDNHFLFSPSAIWLSLAALAEGSDPSLQGQLFKLLYLPQEKCSRDKFYNFASHAEEPGKDVHFVRRRGLVIDENLEVNTFWSQYVQSSGLLLVVQAAIRSHPEATSERLQRFLQTHSNIYLKGNSILVDSLDYEGLWTTAFDDLNTYQAPFYNDLGIQTGTIEMMKAKKRFRLADVPFMNTKVLELPVGINGRYTMLIAVGTRNNVLQNAVEIFLGSVFRILNLLEMSLVPVEIAVPKFFVNSEFDVRPALEEMGIDRFWIDPAATSYVSHPPALPGSYIQRTSVRIASKGLEAVSSEGGGIISGLVNLATNTASELVSGAGHNFVANRPFMYALFDTKTQTCIFAGAYSKPTGKQPFPFE